MNTNLQLVAVDYGFLIINDFNEVLADIRITPLDQKSCELIRYEILKLFEVTK